MKKNRQGRILELIQEENIETQEELADRLGQEGFIVTQATVSRDIRGLYYSADYVRTFYTSFLL